VKTIGIAAQPAQAVQAAAVGGCLANPLAVAAGIAVGGHGDARERRSGRPRDQAGDAAGGGQDGVDAGDVALQIHGHIGRRVNRQRAAVEPGGIRAGRVIEPHAVDAGRGNAEGVVPVGVAAGRSQPLPSPGFTAVEADINAGKARSAGACDAAGERLGRSEVGIDGDAVTGGEGNVFGPLQCRRDLMELGQVVSQGIAESHAIHAGGQPADGIGAPAAAKRIGERLPPPAA